MAAVRQCHGAITVLDGMIAGRIHPGGHFDDVLRTQGSDDRIIAPIGPEHDAMCRTQVRDVDGVVAVGALDSDGGVFEARRSEVTMHGHRITSSRTLVETTAIVGRDIEGIDADSSMLSSSATIATEPPCPVVVRVMTISVSAFRPWAPRSDAAFASARNSARV